MSKERNPLSKGMMDMLNASDELSRLRAELKEAEAERDTLRQQLAVAREGLDHVYDLADKACYEPDDDFDQIADKASATLAKLEKP